MIFHLEYPIHSSINILFERLSTISGLSEWFADDVNIDREGIYTFTWEGSSQQALLVSKKKDNSFVLNGLTLLMTNTLSLKYKSMT